MFNEETVTMLATLLLLMVPFINSAPTELWDHCNCRFLEWSSWSKCSKECNGGRQSRDRMVQYTKGRGCSEFSHCATPGSGLEYRNCNEFCYNGGSYKSYCTCLPIWQGSFWDYRNCNILCFDGEVGTYISYCLCPRRWKGSCCDEEVTCGSPGSISNGRVVGSSYYYGSTVTYVCNTHFRLTRGSTTQRCSSNGYWTGTKPLCLFANTCQSNPCQHGGTCVNEIQRYYCLCVRGWNGVNCEIDVQPPVMTGCPSEIDKVIATPTVIVNWTEPSFYDPMGTALQISNNYPQNHWEFILGDFMVQYSALKVANGLRTECIFKIKVRPHNCSRIDEPHDHTASVCTNWMTDYGQYCLVFCDKFFTLSNINNYNQWFVCGASGRWIPSSHLPKCDRLSDSLEVTNRNEYHYESCEDETSITQMKEFFIRRMNESEFSYFCRSHNDKCSAENVAVTCN